MTPSFRTSCARYRQALSVPVFVLLALLAPICGASTATPIDKVAVIVNDDVITEAEINARMKLVQEQLKKASRDQMPPYPVLRRQVVESMIVERVQLQRAEAIGLKVDDTLLDQAFAELAQRNKMTSAQFEKTLKKEGANLAEFRDQLRTQTQIRQLVNREVNSRIQITEEDVDDFLRKQEQQQNRSVEYNISHILLTIPQKPSAADIARYKKEAETIRQKLVAGESFATLAASHSKDQYALQGGLIGWRTTGQLPELFANALAKMKPGDISPVLQSANGFHVLKLNEQRGGISATYRVTQTHARHILFKPQSGISDSYIRERLNLLRQRILNGEDFGKVANAYSEDVASAINNGDLGWVTPGTMVPSFEQAMNRLQVGEISPIISSPYGYHIIQVLGRRQADLGKEKLRADARRELHVRKAEEYYQTWIRRLRDQAYVEILG